MSLRLRYGRAALIRDYGRAAAGTAMCLALLALGPPGGIVFWVFLALTLLFVGFGMLTALRQATVLDLDETGINRMLIGPAGLGVSLKRIEFEGLDGFSLRYYGGRKDRGQGIVEVAIRAGKARLKADRSLVGFDDLVLSCRAAAERRSIELDPATTANLSTLGYG